MSVVQYEQPQPLPPTTRADEQDPGPVGWVARLRAAAEYANYVGDTEFVPQPLRGRPAAIAAAILYGAEVGLNPMRALAMIAVIKGRPAMLAEGQRAKILAEGHEIWFDESTITRAIAAGRRRGEERVGRITWTMDDAKRAGLAGNPAYRAYPAEMLRARASAALARTMFPDVIGGLAAVEELEGEPDNGTAPTPTPEDVQPATAPSRTRRRARAAAPAPPAAAEPAAAQPLPPTPPPDTQPEPEPPEQPLATDAYKRRIFATMRDLGISELPREQRLTYIARVVGREITSSNELTIGEASRLIEQLDADKAAREAGEQTFIDELRATFDAEPTGAGAPDAPTEPVPYNEFPEGF